MRARVCTIHADSHGQIRIKFVPDKNNLPPPVKQTVASLKQHSVKKSSLSFLNKNNHPHHSITNSMPASPSLNGARTPLVQKSTTISAPTLTNDKNQRFEALRVPLIHLLAIRPVSAKYLAQTLGSKEEYLQPVLEKIGKRARLDPMKWDLNDKTFKELNVWKFDYPAQHDRELAIDRAGSAFDRMRLSQEDKLWQMLYEKHERGKGNTLSKLKNLHKGPIQRATTPRIHVQEPAESTEQGQRTFRNGGEDKGRLTPSAAQPMSRSKSHDQIKKTKVSEKEARSKRLMNKGPKKVTPAPKVKEAHPAVKKGGPKKANVPKSDEFVNDSDEEDGLEDSMALDSQSQIPNGNGNSTKSTKHVAVADKTIPPSTEPSTKMSKPATSSQHTTSNLAVKKTVSKDTKQPTSSQPQKSRPTMKEKTVAKPKPSTSAPTSASSKPKPAVHGDLKPKAAKGQAEGSAPAGRTPQKDGLSPNASSSASKRRLSDASASSTAIKKTISRSRNGSSPHKPSPLGSSPPTNASDLDNVAHSSASSTPLMSQTRKPNGTPTNAVRSASGHARNSSEASLKRKANDLESGIHNHSGPLANGHVDGHVNGYISSAKRRKISDPSLPSSESDNSPPTKDMAVQKARFFKKYYTNYEIEYRKVLEMKEPPHEDVERVNKLHQRLIELKEELTEISKGI